MMRIGNIDTEEQAQAFQRGSETALSFFFHEFYPALTLFAFRWTKNRQIAQEIASEAFIKTWKMHRKLNSYPGIRAYLYKIVQRDSQRARKRAQRYDISNQLAVEEGMCLDTPFQHLVRSETYRLIHTAIKSLSPGNRKVITMHFLDGKTTAQIARELNLHPHTVQTQKTRGLKALRKIIQSPLLFSAFLLVKFFFLSL